MCPSFFLDGSFHWLTHVSDVSNAVVERMSGRHPHGHHHHLPSSSIHNHNHNHEPIHEHDHEESSEVFGPRYFDEPEEEQPLIEGLGTVTVTASTPNSTPADTQRSRRSLRDRRTASHISLGHHRSV